MKRVKFSINSYTSHKFFFVPDDQFETIRKQNWRLSKKQSGGHKTLHYSYYVSRSATKREREQGYPSQIELQRYVMKLKKGDPLVVDHLDNNTLNNDYSNLKKKTGQGNARNRKDKIPGSLWGVKYRKGPNGVRWGTGFTLPRNGKKPKVVSVGTYATEVEAHIACCNKWLKLVGTPHTLDKRYAKKKMY